MATMRNDDSGIAFTLTIDVIEEQVQPPLISGSVSVLRGDAMLLRPTSLTFIPGDRRAVERCLERVGAGIQPACRVANIDEDFTLEVVESESEVPYHFGIWIGEPYVLMRGFRFTMDRNAMEAFVRDLQAEEKQVSG